MNTIRYCVAAVLRGVLGIAGWLLAAVLWVTSGVVMLLVYVSLTAAVAALVIAAITKGLDHQVSIWPEVSAAVVLGLGAAGAAVLVQISVLLKQQLEHAMSRWLAARQDRRY